MPQPVPPSPPPAVQSPPDWQEILTYFRGSELQNYFMRVLEDNLKVGGGGEGDGGSVARAITEMCQDVPNFTLIRHMWQPWEKFIELIASMNIMIQPSYTESFNMVTADGIVVGVPSVVSSAITWAPDSWKADSDDALDIARTGCLMLQNSGTIYSGLKSLKHQNRYALEHWEKYLFER